MININKTINKTLLVSYLKIEVSELILFTSCLFRVVLFDDTNNVIDVEFFKLEGNDYIKWNDDNYITEWIKSQI